MSHGNEDMVLLARAQYIVSHTNEFTKFQVNWAKDIIKLLGD
jgi:hypothetical protein